jgi:hypothetical protein
MANVIKCPACGKDNQSDLEFCQYCQARLQPLTGNLKGADAPLKPGQIPTKKDTGELEPILPQWLREARNSARQISNEDATQDDQIHSPSESPQASLVGDLLAGLNAQRQAQDDEEDTPDWLANITGETPKQKKSQTESSEVRWVELGDPNDFAQSEPVSDTPSWLAGITPQPGEKDELADWSRVSTDPQKSQQSSQPTSFDSQPSDTGTQDWLHSMAADDGAFNDSENAVDEPLTFSDTPDWLRAMDVENDAQKTKVPSSDTDAPPVDSDTPDWLRTMAADNGTPLSTSGTPPISSDDTPDWLRAMAADNAAPLSTSSVPPVDSDTPDWLRTMGAQEKTQGADSAGFSETGLGESDAPPSSAGDTADWFKGLESDSSSSDLDWLKGLPSTESGQPAQDSAPAWLSAAPTFTPEQEQTPAAPEKDDAADIPSWMIPAAAATAASAPEQEANPPAPEKDDDVLDIPSWLKAAAPQSSIFDEPANTQEIPAPASSDSSDWLNAFKSVESPDAQSIPAFSKETPLDSEQPLFADGAKPSANDDALFTDMPAWLSNVDETVSPESIPSPITNKDAIAPVDLPSWVQAMRPVDAGVPQSSSTSLSSDRKLEASGALAGLLGVLPAVNGFSPTSKPKAYSIKMQASEEQQMHAALLEQILAAETEPVPIGSFSTFGTSRVLRWVIALVLFAALTIVLFTRTQIFSMPVGLPVEVVSALNVIRSIPEGAPVLAVFDYDPARVGEMEVAAAPAFDQLLLLRHPRLTFISTTETGAILAERFISGPLAGYNYQSGDQYLNLGYLPGGQMGIRAFAENPAGTARYTLAQSPNPLDLTLAPAGTVPPLSQFAALILISDNADSARAWIEQTASARGAVPLVVISSAQAAPMIQPYYASQQVNGLVSGLYGGALFEQNNAGRPGTARTYWDAYSIGMLLAMALILGGGLLNLALGINDRTAARESK